MQNILPAKSSFCHGYFLELWIEFLLSWSCVNPDEIYMLEMFTGVMMRALWFDAVTWKNRIYNREQRVGSDFDMFNLNQAVLLDIEMNIFTKLSLNALNDTFAFCDILLLRYSQSKYSLMKHNSWKVSEKICLSNRFNSKASGKVGKWLD